MVEYTQGNLLNEDAEALVNSVNCVGVMGRGIALQFKNAYPENYTAYVAACKRGEVQPGSMFIHETGQLTNPRFIINFPTKRHWRGKSRIEDIEAGLKSLVEVLQNHNIRSIAIPPLGSGLGGLDWNNVKKLIQNALEPLRNVRILVYEPGGASDSNKIVRNKEVPRMTPGRAALIALMQTYLEGLLDPFVTLLEVHKLMYFLQEAGEPLRLNFNKGIYGPYAENLRHVLHAVEGHMIYGYADGGDKPDKQLQLVPGAIADASNYLARNSDTSERLKKVVQLVEGFETPFGLELLSTVYWVVNVEKADSLEAVTARTYAWGERKKQFTHRQIELAVNVLVSRGWLKGIK